MTTNAGRAPSGQALAVPATPLRVDGPSGFDPSRLHGDIKLMLLASPTDENSALMKTGLTMREWEFATTSGAYRQVYRPARKEFGFQLTAKGRKMRAAIAMEAAKPSRRETGSTEGDSAGPKDIAQKEAP